MSSEKLLISIKEIKKILKHNYNIIGSINRLDGEIDYNFRVESSDKKEYLLKISRSNFNLDYIDYQIKLLDHLKKDFSINIPLNIQTIKGENFCIEKDSQGDDRCIRLLSWINGRLWSSVNPIEKELRIELGSKTALLSQSLEKFKHPYSNRKIDWDIANSEWVEGHLKNFSVSKRVILENFIKDFKNNLSIYNDLKKSVIHNDINDNNIIVSNEIINPNIESIIDFGDSVYSQRINDLAIACSYGIMNLNDPLEGCCEIISGYNKLVTINDNELSLLYNLIGMRLIISVTKSFINRDKEPDNKYLLISEKPAWNLLKSWSEINSEYAYYSFRKACNLDAHPNKKKFTKWVRSKKFNVKDLFPKLQKDKFYKIDLSVGSEWIGGRNEIEDLDVFQFKIDKLQKEQTKKIIAGGYLEPRSIYTSDNYEKIGNYGTENRTIHLGIDFWLPTGTKVSAMFDGEVVTAINDKGHKEYGGLVILKHRIEDIIFYSLYGHNTVESVLKNKIGSKVRKGEIIAEIANYPENGNWAPHLHFQIMLSMLDYKIDFPGVCYFNQIDVWKDLCPDPNLLLNQKI